MSVWVIASVCYCHANIMKTKTATCYSTLKWKASSSHSSFSEIFSKQKFIPTFDCFKSVKNIKDGLSKIVMF